MIHSEYLPSGKCANVNYESPHILSAADSGPEMYCNYSFLFLSENAFCTTYQTGSQIESRFGIRTEYLRQRNATR